MLLLLLGLVLGCLATTYKGPDVEANETVPLNFDDVYEEYLKDKDTCEYQWMLRHIDDLELIILECELWVMGQYPDPNMMPRVTEVIKDLRQCVGHEVETNADFCMAVIVTSAGGNVVS